jgi:uncharacterized protein (DUF2141 family)
MKAMLPRIESAVFGAALLLAALLPGCAEKVAPEDRAAPQQGDIVVELTGFRNSSGQAVLSLYRSEDGFPGEPEKAFRRVGGPVSADPLGQRFTGVPYGEYAVSALHDENADGRMNTNILGMPQEGYGTSNNPAPRIGPPLFDEARFVLGEPVLEIGISMRYGR